MTSSAFHAKSTALEVVKGLNAKLDGKVVLITGATSGNIFNKKKTQYKKYVLSIKVLVLKQLVH